MTHHKKLRHLVLAIWLSLRVHNFQWKGPLRSRDAISACSFWVHIKWDPANGMSPPFQIFYGSASWVLHLSRGDQSMTSCSLILPLRSPISLLKFLRLKGSQLQLLKWVVIKMFWTGGGVGGGVGRTWTASWSFHIRNRERPAPEHKPLCPGP